MQSLRDMRIERGLTLEAAAQKLQMTMAGLSRLERGLTRPQTRTIAKLAKFYDKPVEIIRQSTHLDTYHDGILSMHGIGRTVQIPIIGDTAAGYGAEAVPDWTGEFAALPLDALHGANPREFFALHVRGQSMEPRIMDGDIAIIHRQMDVDDGDIALVVYGDDIDPVGSYGTLKRVEKNSDGSLSLVALNPDYETLTIAGQKLQSVQIQGRLTQTIRMF